jgi:hypothetical protein
MSAPKVNLVAGLFTRKLVRWTTLGKFHRHDKYRISLNMYMKYKGLEKAYEEVLEETWNGLSMNLPPVKGGRETPSETAMGLAYRRGFNIDNGSLYNQNAANGQQPYEQEEAPIPQRLTDEQRRIVQQRYARYKSIMDDPWRNDFHDDEQAEDEWRWNNMVEEIMAQMPPNVTEDMVELELERCS